MKVSLIIPARNEGPNLLRLNEEVTQVAEGLSDYEFEFILIDNDSCDETRPLALNFCQSDPRWKYIKLTRNFGSEASIDVGINFCSGDAGIVLFSDLQDPPELIPEMIKKWREGFDIVFGVYGGKAHEVLWKRIFVKCYYKILKRISDPPMVPFAGDFRLYDKKVLRVLRTLRERNRYMRGLAQWVGFKSTSVEYERRPRIAGKSKAPPFYLFQFAFSVIVNFSDKPLKTFGWFGIVTLGFSMLAAVFLVVNYFTKVTVPGFTSTQLLLIFNLGFTGLGFGVLGEYISKIYLEVKERPIWLIEDAVNIETSGREIGQ